MKDQPELAIITFAVGVELSLKARLAFEHWHLILAEEKGKPSECWAQLRSGKARTAGADKLLTLLLRVLSATEAKKLERGSAAFSGLADLRNRAVHFGIKPSDPAHEPAALAAVQLRSWHALQEFAASWPEELRKAAEKDWKRAEQALVKLKAFLDTRAEELLPHLKDLQNAGGAVGLCMQCTYVGLAAEAIDSRNFGLRECRICRAESLASTAPCPRCSKPMLASLNGEETFELYCVTCEYSGEEESFGSASIADPPPPGDDPDAGAPLCGECGTGEQTTHLEVDGKDWFACQACDTHWNKGWDDVESCDNCSERWVGVDLETSGFTGCPLCEDAMRERFERM